MTVVKINFLHVNEQAYVIALGASIATPSAKLNVSGLPRSQR